MKLEMKIIRERTQSTRNMETMKGKRIETVLRLLWFSLVSPHLSLSLSIRRYLRCLVLAHCSSVSVTCQVNQFQTYLMFCSDNGSYPSVLTQLLQAHPFFSLLRYILLEMIDYINLFSRFFSFAPCNSIFVQPNCSKQHNDILLKS